MLAIIALLRCGVKRGRMPGRLGWVTGPRGRRRGGGPVSTKSWLRVAGTATRGRAGETALKEARLTARRNYLREHLNKAKQEERACRARRRSAVMGAI